MDFAITEKEYKIDNYDSSILELEIKGKDVNHVYMNSLRKVCMDQIPIYAIPTQKITILRNNSVFNGTEIKNRLSLLPIKRINHNVKFLSLRYYKNVNFADPRLERHPEDNIDVEYYLNIKNNGPEEILYVTTDHLRISVNDNVIRNEDMYKGKKPILLTKLRPGEEIELSMKNALAVGELNAIFNASNTYFEEITENEYRFMIESSGQFTEYELLIRGIEIIIEKLKIIKENIADDKYYNLTTNNNCALINLTNEDYTCGGPINYVLQELEEVEVSGITKPNFMEKNITIKFRVNKKHNPIDIFIKAIDINIGKFEEILEKVQSIKK